jgi:hypothetical protein
MAPSDPQIARFDRKFFGEGGSITRIGSGAVGGKAAGLERVRRDLLASYDPSSFPSFSVGVPSLTVLATDLFDEFMAANDLYPVALGEASDDRIAHAFQKATLPPQHMGDLRSLVSEVRTPLAVRSSSLLEDALDHPFAGVYVTKMIPNNQPDADSRFQRLIEAVKFVYASTFFAEAKGYIRSVGREADSEKMAIVIQEVVGQRFGERFYPGLSGVVRSYNYYPFGGMASEHGVASLALGLGKQIVDGGACWTYSPVRPRTPPPYKDLNALIKNSQTEFWAVNMGRPPMPDPVQETEYLVRRGLDAAEYDGVLEHLASTLDPRSGRLRPGLSGDGPRVLDFAPMLTLRTVPLNDLLRGLLSIAERVQGGSVECEFAVTLRHRGGEPLRFGFLQMRPMMKPGREIEISSDELRSPGAIVISENVLGNGERSDITDVVFLKPGAFEAGRTREMASELEKINRLLVDEGRHYLLIGFGRWGSADPWLGVPVGWGQISGARVIVESSLPGMSPDLSQGSHFFHNLISFRVLYLSTGRDDPDAIDWSWLDGRETLNETAFVKRVRCERPLTVRVDGRRRRGIVKHE